jgi:hypothetical protein
MYRKAMKKLAVPIVLFLFLFPNTSNPMEEGNRVYQSKQGLTE